MNKIHSISPYLDSEFIEIIKKTNKKLNSDESPNIIIKPSNHFAPKALKNHKWVVQKRNNNNNNNVFQLSSHRNNARIEIPPVADLAAAEEKRMRICTEFFQTEETFINTLKDFAEDRTDANGRVEPSTLSNLIQYYRNSPKDQRFLIECQINFEEVIKNSPLQLMQNLDPEARQEIFMKYFLGECNDVNTKDFFDSLTILSAYQSKLQDYIDKAPREIFRANNKNQEDRAFAYNCIITPVQRAPRYEMIMQEFNKSSSGLEQEQQNKITRSMETITRYNAMINRTTKEIAPKLAFADIKDGLEKVKPSEISFLSIRRNLAVIRNLVRSLHITAEDLRAIPAMLSETLTRSDRKRLLKRMDGELNRLGDFNDLERTDALNYLKWQSLRNQLEDTLYPALASVRRISGNRGFTEGDLHDFTDTLSASLSRGQKKQLRKQIDNELKKLNAIEQKNDQENTIYHNLGTIRARLIAN